MTPRTRTSTTLGARNAMLGAALASAWLACTPPASTATATATAAATATPIASGTPTATAIPASDTATATTTATASSAASGTIVAGRIASIVLQDVSKAAGRHHYNVSLVVEGTIEGAWPFATPRPTRYEVRVDKVYFGALDEAARAALAPEGPKYRLTPPRYGRYAVGDAVRVPVRPSSPDIGWLEAP
jgi:hypothetical protein